MNWTTTPLDDPRGYPIRIVNDVCGWEKLHYSGKPRGELVESLLWGASRSTNSVDDILDAADAEPIGCCIYVMESEIVLRFYATGDEAAAREAIEALLGAAVPAGGAA
jgi:hypothetical protein